MNKTFEPVDINCLKYIVFILILMSLSKYFKYMIHAYIYNLKPWVSAFGCVSTLSVHVYAIVDIE